MTPLPLSPNAAVARLRRENAFSLTEVVIAVGLMILVAALLLMALGGVRQMQRQSACVSNLRQVGQLLLAYSVDHNGTIHPGSNNRSTWSRLLMEQYHGIPITALPSQEALQIFYCPELRAMGHTGDSAPTAHYWTTYSINGNVMGTGAGTRPLRKMVEFENPARVGLMWDASTAVAGPPGRSVGAVAAYHIQAGNPNQSVGFVHGSKDRLKRRGGKAGTLFLDGHVSLLPDPGDGRYLDIQRTGNQLW